MSDRTISTCKLDTVYWQRDAVATESIQNMELTRERGCGMISGDVVQRDYIELNKQMHCHLELGRTSVCCTSSLQSFEAESMVGYNAETVHDNETENA